jgi:hypothetical protein
MNEATSAVTPLDPELVGPGDVAGQRAGQAYCFKARCGRCVL